MSSHDVKRQCKQVMLIGKRLGESYGRVLPPTALRAGLSALTDLVTVDVAGIMALYHLRNMSAGGLDPRAFQEGSEERMLLKLHHRFVGVRVGEGARGGARAC